MIQTLVILLAASVFFVPISRRFGFGSVLGYLLAGVAIGRRSCAWSPTSNRSPTSRPWRADAVFLIGPGAAAAPYLADAPRAVLGLGSAQVLVTGAALAGLAHLAGADWPAAAVLGVGLSLSSTAIVLPMLAERDILGAASGRDSFAVLLFQDIASVPLVAAVPFLVGGTSLEGMPWLAIAKAAGGVAVILLGGRLLMPAALPDHGQERRARGVHRHPPCCSSPARRRSPAPWACRPRSAPSPPGVLLSESEYRHELRADVEPFEGLLLGFFFISVGHGSQRPPDPGRARPDPHRRSGDDHREDRCALRPRAPAQTAARHGRAHRARPAAGQRVRLRALRRGRGRRRPAAADVGARDADDRHLDAGEPP